MISVYISVYISKSIY